MTMLAFYVVYNMFVLYICFISCSFMLVRVARHCVYLFYGVGK